MNGCRTGMKYHHEQLEFHKPVKIDLENQAKCTVPSNEYSLTSILYLMSSCRFTLQL